MEITSQLGDFTTEHQILDDIEAQEVPPCVVGAAAGEEAQQKPWISEAHKQKQEKRADSEQGANYEAN